ncbi:MAG: response regulator transcription factor [Bacteroidia bacterium]|nr:response regulator transcription factor [Bacteroidia bacterium]
MKEKIKIGIADDHPLVRHGLAMLLKRFKTVHLLFEVVNGEELFESLKTNNPDILLLDLKMPGMEAHEILDRINQKHRSLKVIIISSHYDEDHIIECFKYGVKAFLAKDDKIEKVMEAIFAVYEHDIYTDREVSKILASHVKVVKRTKNTKKPLLSATEIEVLKLVSKGIPRKDVADKLGVKPETINFHMNNMIRKTKSQNAPALTSYAIKNKIIKP